MRKIWYSIAFVTLTLGVSSMTLQPDDRPITELSTPEDQLTWYTSLEKAHKESTETGKPIFAFFTGSDWCGWCHKLQREVFAKDAFVSWANTNVVLLELDFPKRTQLDSATRVQNYNLQKGFNVRGYPTIWIFNTTLNEETKVINISPLGSLGYPRGAVVGKEEEKFLSDANKILTSGK